MNDLILENLLRKAPAPAAPAGLEEALFAGIQLQSASALRREAAITSRSWKRWISTLLYGGFAGGCLAVIVTQEAALSTLRRANEALRAETQGLSAWREANVEVQNLRRSNADLNRLRQDNADVARLQSEIARLRSEIDGLDALRAENQRLRSLAAATVPGALPDFFAEAKARAERIACVNHLKQIGLAARIWANDHNGACPKDFITMTNELVTWTVLQCPSDSARPIKSWEQVAAGDVSYQIDSPGLNTEHDDPDTVAYECPFHRNICLLDGAVQQLSAEGVANSIKIDKFGRKVFKPEQQ